MSKTESYRRWSADEVSYLHKNYDTMTAEAIADALNRTPDSVWEKSSREGLRKHAKRHARSAEGPWHCPKCGHDKAITEFGKGTDNRGAPYCKVCTNRIQSDKRRQKRRNNR